MPLSKTKNLDDCIRDHDRTGILLETKLICQANKGILIGCTDANFFKVIDIREQYRYKQPFAPEKISKKNTGSFFFTIDKVKSVQKRS